jgi:hypothetical protein
MNSHHFAPELVVDFSISSEPQRFGLTGIKRAQVFGGDTVAAGADDALANKNANAITHGVMSMFRMMMPMLTVMSALIAGVAFAPSAAKSEICRTGQPGQFGTISYCASSVLAPQGSRSYGPLQAAGGAGTAWVEGVAGDGVGQWLQVRWSDGACFRTVVIRNGYGRNRAIFLGNNRVRTAQLTASDGFSMRILLPDSNAPHSIRLPRIVKARWLRLTILSVYRGSRWRDTAIGGFYADLEELNYDKRCR